MIAKTEIDVHGLEAAFALVAGVYNRGVEGTRLQSFARLAAEAMLALIDEVARLTPLGDDDVDVADDE